MTARLTTDRCYVPSHDAAFHPNLTRVLHLKVKGRPTTATHDLGAYTYECRHFVDREYLCSVPGGVDLLEGIAPSEPPCRRVEMVGAAPAEVLGMLPDKLPCTLWTPAGAGARRKLCLDLAGVLVVESLPVPLHVSLKSLMESCGDDETLASHLCVAAQGDPVENRFGRAAFPERYRDHDFWLDRDPKTDPKSNLPREQVIRAESALMAARGRDGVEYASCALCRLMGSEEDGVFLKRCAGCDVTHYCSRQCQHAHWGVHKASCVRSRGARSVDERRGGDEPWRADGIRSLEGSVRSLGLTESRTDMGMLAAADMPDTPQRRSIDGDSNFSDEDGGSPTFGTCEPHPQTARPPGGK